MEIIDYVGALAVLRDARKTHRGARDVTLGIGDELVELLEIPLAALGLHRGRIVEPRLGRAVAADDTPEIGTDAVRTALLEGVAGLTNLGGGLALLHGGRLQQFLDRLGGGCGGAALLGVAGL